MRRISRLAGTGLPLHLPPLLTLSVPRPDEKAALSQAKFINLVAAKHFINDGEMPLHKVEQRPLC